MQGVPKCRASGWFGAQTPQNGVLSPTDTPKRSASRRFFCRGRRLCEVGGVQEALVTRPSDTPRDTLSWRWFGIDWREHMPWNAGDLSIEYGTHDDALPFIRDHYPSIFGPPREGWTVEPFTAAKLRFLQESDVFVIRDRERVAGIAIGNPLDWSSYYIRSLALLPEYRGRNVPRSLLQRIAPELRRAGVVRIETDVVPTNTDSTLTHELLGFVATGMNNHDRWGSLLRFTGYLDDEVDETYRKKFCASGKPHRRRSLVAGAGREQ